MSSHESEYFHESGGLEANKLKADEGATSPLEKFKRLWSEADQEGEAEYDDDEPEAA